MALNNRYEPSHPQGQNILYGLDFANILPDGVTIQPQGTTINVQLNTVPPTNTTDLNPSIDSVTGRRIYIRLQGGTAGTDYRINYQALDSLGNSWLRTVLLLCAATS